MAIYIIYNSSKIWNSVSTRFPFMFIEQINWQTIICIKMIAVRQWIISDPSSLALGLHCQQAYSQVHYLLNCPPHPMYWCRLKGHLLPENYKLPDHHLAAFTIRKSAMDYIISTVHCIFFLKEEHRAVLHFNLQLHVISSKRASGIGRYCQMILMKIMIIMYIQ